MPKGYQGEKGFWNRTHKELLAIDSELKSFAKLHSLELKKGNDWHTRSLVWKKNNIKRRILITLREIKTFTFCVVLIASEEREGEGCTVIKTMVEYVPI